jgi:succinate dehydrogenase / fumarate reductase, cytochrome b subunit
MVAMQWYKSSLGKKYIMAVTGLIMVLFVIAHMFGNFTIFGGADGINAYAAGLRAIAPALWLFRLVMLAVFLVHIWMGVSLYLENKAARPNEYAMKKNHRTSFSAQTMIWTGVLLGAFVIFHVLHFTVHAFHPYYSTFVDPAQRPDVFRMVVMGFQAFPITLLYLAAMVILLLHLAHGIQSFFQSLGATNDATLPSLEKGGRGVAVVILLGFVIVPITIFFGVIRL